MEELATAVTLYQKLGLAEFIIFVVVICAAIWFIKVFVKRNAKNIVSANKEEFNHINQIIEEVKAITENNNNRFQKLEERLDNDAEKRESRKVEVDNKFNQIETRFNELSAIITDHEEFQKKISQGTLENMLFNEEISPFRRLKAFRKLIALGKNGWVKERGIKLVLKYKEEWRNVCDTNLDVEIVNQKHWDYVMAELDRLVFDKI